MLKVLIADDHPIVRKGLTQILEDAPETMTTDEAGDGLEAVEKAFNNDFDMVLMDITMPKSDGLEALKQLKKYKPKLPVLMLSMYPEEQYAIRALKAGASGYLTKQSAPDELLIAIKRVLAGRKYISASLAEKLASNIEKDLQGPVHEQLSDREYQILRMIATGKSVSDIAGELHLSVKTISTYRARVLGKMNMKHNADLTYYAIKNQLVD